MLPPDHLTDCSGPGAGWPPDLSDMSTYSWARFSWALTAPGHPPLAARAAWLSARAPSAQHQPRSEVLTSR